MHIHTLPTVGMGFPSIYTPSGASKCAGNSAPDVPHLPGTRDQARLPHLPMDHLEHGWHYLDTQAKPMNPQCWTPSGSSRERRTHLRRLGPCRRSSCFSYTCSSCSSSCMKSGSSVASISTALPRGMAGEGNVQRIGFYPLEQLLIVPINSPQELPPRGDTWLRRDVTHHRRPAHWGCGSGASAGRGPRSPCPARGPSGPAR